jgi:hypothetical protein
MLALEIKGNSYGSLQTLRDFLSNLSRYRVKQKKLVVSMKKPDTCLDERVIYGHLWRFIKKDGGLWKRDMFIDKGVIYKFYPCS